jgi:hypothetical protein
MKLPDAVENYDPECWKLFGLVETHVTRLGLEGPPGTGKTTTPMLSAKRRGRTTFNMTFRLETPATDLIGCYALKGGEFVWADGIFSRGWRLSQTTPVTFVLNEIDQAGPDSLGQLYNLLDDPEIAVLDLPNGERLKPGDVQYVGTMNGSFDQLPPAIRDRFPVVLNIDKPHPAGLKRLPDDVRCLALDAAYSRNPERQNSMRSFFEFAKLRPSIGEATAAVAVFGARHGDVLNALQALRAKYA